MPMGSAPKTIYTLLLLWGDIIKICNSYTMGCLPVRGDNPRALASGLSYILQVDVVTILYHLYDGIHQCRPCTSQDI